MAAVALIVATLDMPYGYYTFLRLLVTSVALITAWHAITCSAWFLWVIIMGLIAFLFNPVIPVHLPREAWFIIDLAVAVVFSGYALSRLRAVQNQADSK